MKALIIGIDGGTWDVINPMVQEGKLPNISRIMDEGACGILQSTIPPLTAPAWVSFMTGKKPGEHPYFDFKIYDITNYAYSYQDAKFLHSGYIKGQTLWDAMSHNDLKIGVINIPMTYPAWRINGVMVSGFPSPRISVCPEDFESKVDLNQILVPELGEMSKDERFDYCTSLVDIEESLGLEVIERLNVDVLAMNFLSSDIVQHYYMKEYVEKDSKFSDAIPAIYSEIDKVIGVLGYYLDNRGSITIFSDHGAGLEPTRYFNINSWLKAEGFLEINRSRFEKMGKEVKVLPDRVATYINSEAIDLESTMAYRFPLKPPAEGIVINLKGRQPSGKVSPNEYDNIIETIIKQFKNSTDDLGHPFVEEIHRREDLYGKKYIQNSPDIVFLVNSRYKGTSKVTNIIFEDIPNPYAIGYSGAHRKTGIYILSGFENTKIGNTINIYDLTGIVLRNLGIRRSIYQRIKDKISDLYE